MKHVLPRLTSPGEMTLTDGRLPDRSTGTGSSSSMLNFRPGDSNDVRQACLLSADAPVFYAMTAAPRGWLTATAVCGCHAPHHPRPSSSSPDWSSVGQPTTAAGSLRRSDQAGSTHTRASDQLFTEHAMARNIARTNYYLPT